MAHCLVTHVRIDNFYNVITHIGFGTSWERSKQQAISDIESGANTYYTDVNGVSADVVVMPGYPKYLRTDPDRTSANNLLALPRF